MTGRAPALVRGQRRRSRAAFLALLRRSNDYTMRAWAVRCVAVLVFAATAASSRWFPLLLVLAFVPALGCYLLWANERSLRRDTVPRFWLSRVYRRDLDHTDGRHRMSLGSKFDLSGSFLMVVGASFVATDAPVVARLVLLGAATVFFVSAALLIFNDHTWFNPSETTPPLWHELVRTVAGPVCAALVLVVVLPADWGPRGELAALVIALTPLTVSVRISDTDLILRYLAPLVREEAHAGRELVISGTHGALSTNLRLLEQHARGVRETHPVIHELAVAANSRLRETLALSEVSVDSSTDLSTLAAPVLTLARAVGAKADVEVAVEELGEPDRDLVRLVLSDLVGNALNAGAAEIVVRVAGEGAALCVSVTDDAPPMPPGVWKTPGTSSARLEQKVMEWSGALEATQQGAVKTVTARWLARPG